jgi:hypothetical protein
MDSSCVRKICLLLLLSATMDKLLGRVQHTWTSVICTGLTALDNDAFIVPLLLSDNILQCSEESCS